MSKLPWPVFWAAVGAIVTSAAGALPTLLEVPVYLSTAVIVGLSILGSWVARATVRRAKPFGVSWTRLGLVETLVTVAVCTHGLIAVLMVIRPEWWLLWPFVILGYEAAAIAISYAHRFILETSPDEESKPKGSDANSPAAKVAWIARDSGLTKMQPHPERPYELIFRDGKPVGVNLRYADVGRTPRRG